MLGPGWHAENCKLGKLIVSTKPDLRVDEAAQASLQGRKPCGDARPDPAHVTPPMRHPGPQTGAAKLRCS